MRCEAAVPLGQILFVKTNPLARPVHFVGLKEKVRGRERSDALAIVTVYEIRAKP